MNPDDKFFARAWPRMTRQLTMLKSAVDRDGGRLKVVALPSVVQVDQAGSDAARRIGYAVDEAWLREGCRVETATTKELQARIDYELD